MGFVFRRKCHKMHGKRIHRSIELILRHHTKLAINSCLVVAELFAVKFLVLFLSWNIDTLRLLKILRNCNSFRSIFSEYHCVLFFEQPPTSSEKSYRKSTQFLNSGSEKIIGFVLMAPPGLHAASAYFFFPAN